MKTCSKCQKDYPLDHFYKDKRYSDGRVNQCRSCRLDAGNAWRKLNIEKVRSAAVARYAVRTPEKVEADRQSERKRTIERHGITLDEYNRILEYQGNCCAICKSPEPKGKGDWHIDHDHNCCPSTHSCGKCVRGLLCHHCNSAIGSFEDNVSVLEKAIAYLEKHNDK